MAVKERTVVLVGKDSDGNTCIDMPITTVENVEGAVKTINGNSPDSNGNVGIDLPSAPTDYVTGLSVSGKTITYTKKDGSTGTITTQDTVYTHPISGVTAGSYNKVTVNARGHVTAGENVSIVDLIYPVGSIYMSVKSTSPATLFGGTWKALDQGRVLIGAGTAHPAGETGGEETHTLTTAEMPSHSHSGSTGSTGSHSHTRGSMNITGSVTSSTAAWIKGASSEVSTSGALGVNNYASNNPKAESTAGYNGLTFNGSSGWTGSTSSEGSHSHTVSIGSAGGGSAHNNMQPYLSVYMWKRTA